MSAPETNVEKQRKRHRPALWGMMIGGIFAAIIFLAYLANLAVRGNEPGEDTSAVEPGIEAEEVEPGTEAEE